MPPTRPLTLTGIVVTAGRMSKAVKVRTTRPIYDRTLRKAFRAPTAHLVSDPTTALRAGDVVRFAPWPASPRVRHVVTEIVAPWGPPIAERPAVWTEVERLAARRAKAGLKRARRKERRSATVGGREVGVEEEEEGEKGEMMRDEAQAEPEGKAEAATAGQEGKKVEKRAA